MDDQERSHSNEQDEIPDFKFTLDKAHVLSINPRKKCTFRCVYMSLVVCGLILLAVVITWILTRNQYQKETSKDKIEAAASLLQKMDFSVDPCTDFFQYSCGGWIKDQWKEDINILQMEGDKYLAPVLFYLSHQNPTPDDDHTISQRNLLIAYQVCVRDRTPKDKEQLDAWLDAVFKKDNLNDLLTHSARLGVFVFWEYDWSGAYWAFPSRLDLEKDKIRDYLEKQPGANTNQVDPIYTFLKFKDWRAGYENKKLTSLKGVLGSISFVNATGYFEEFGLRPESDELLIDMELVAHINEYISTNIQVNTRLEFMKSFVALHIQIRFNSRPFTHAMPADQCYRNVGNTYFGFTIGSLKLKLDQGHVNHEDTISTAKAMVNDSVKAYTEIISATDWISESTKLNTLKKIKQMVFLVGIPPWINNDTYIQEINFSGVLTHDMPFIKVFQLIHKDFLVKQLTLKIRDPWLSSLSPHIPLNAVYNTDTNTISLPLGAFIPPYYDNKWIVGMKWGALGSIIAHEMTHAFDKMGMEYDYDGNKVNWWVAEDRDKFIQNQKCFETQYKQYSVLGQQISGTETLNENIADNGGLDISYKAFQSALKQSKDDFDISGVNLTASQIFFITFGQMRCFKTSEKNIYNYLGNYSPPNYRLIGSIQNSDSFSEAFSCPVASPMNSDKKCKVW